MEETIKALQAGTCRFDYGDNNWSLFPGMWLPSKIKIPDFKRYDGTKDPRHHLRHYQSKMLPPTKRRRLIIRPHSSSSNRRSRNNTSQPKAELRLQDLLSRHNGALTPQVASTPFVIEVPVKEPYQDNRVPWNYGGNVANMEQEMSTTGITRSRRVYQGPMPKDKGKAPATALQDVPTVASIPTKKVTEQEAKAFTKIVKASEYKVVEQMGKSPTHISLLALLLSSEPHRDALLKISFPQDELPSKGYGHSRALHIVCKYNNHIVSRVMIDNGSALNVCPVSTLKQMNVDMGRIRASKTTGRAFNSSRREVNREIDLLIDKLKFFAEDKLITVNGEEDYAVYEETPVPYISIGDDQNLPSPSFDIIAVIRDYGEVGPSRADRMIGKVLLKNDYVLKTGLGAHAQGILHPIELEEYLNRRGLGFRPSYHEIVQARRDKHLYRLAAHYGKLFRGITVPPLAQFFLEPPHIVGGTSDSPSSEAEDSSSDTNEVLFALPAIYAITEETSPRIQIHPAQEDEELTNWTSIMCYLAVVADVFILSPKLIWIETYQKDTPMNEFNPSFAKPASDSSISRSMAHLLAKANTSTVSGFHTRSTAFGFHTHTTTVKVSHPFHFIRVSHPHHYNQGFTPAPLHSGFTPRVSHIHHCSQGFTPALLHWGFTSTPLQSGFHTCSTAIGFHTHTIAIKVSPPLRYIWVSHPHHCSQGFTPAPLHSSFTPTPLQSGFHTRSPAFEFHTHTTAVRVSHPLCCIRVFTLRHNIPTHPKQEEEDGHWERCVGHCDQTRVLLNALGCILYSSTQSKRGKLSAPHFGSTVQAMHISNDSGHDSRIHTKGGLRE
ncbi:hypothetical protein CRG98_006159 [Punica granatum]|uniref:G-patch domain-containing protein n=1 Tax=Punica granatum TaxID=22663 RepID=A0A2I0KY98_PUNGR|nr:hypothetical protein CRG98_006159 [Punica granatum]